MPTYTLIASNTVGSGGAASIDFTSIPSTYTDLLVKVSARGTYSGTFINLRMNFNNTASNQTMRRITGNGSATSSASLTNFYTGVMPTAAATSNTFSNFEFYIPNYAGSTNKSASFDSVSENNATESYAILVAGLWSDTSAINRVTLFADIDNLTQYTTAYLYGVSNA